ncbi:UNKNOWN [Stylonychia lemnae]|uniref:Uncharacterized protein n=1 Tax=Stylonychia lemnae TaxID=5949 RepID=A0A077ZXD7_STYLE|nr:UNKNOWN [Stylonychia lemnae]|eukprot:CDW73887.1 UNKNOWN [Stylonychia lemnae]
MLLKKGNQQQKQITEQVKGIFVPKEKRIEARNEIARAHFQIGQADEKFPAKSFSHDHFADLEVKNNQYEENQKIAQQIKQTHFNIGQGKQFFRETISSSSYNQIPTKNLQNTKLNQEVKNELRKAHFHFGNDAVQYETTNKRTFAANDSTAGGTDKKTQLERMQKMRTQHFTYGKDVPQYQSMAKKDYQQHDTMEAKKNLLISKQNGKELRKSHFMFGTDQETYSTNQQAKQVSQINEMRQVPIQNSVNLRKSNFQIEQSAQGGDYFTYETVTGTQMGAVSGGNSNYQVKKAQMDQMNALKQDLRQAHFHLGSNNDQNQYLSSSKQALVDHQISQNTNKEAMELSKKMQHANFNIGDNKNRNLKEAQSQYKQTISAQATTKNQQSATVQLGLRNSNFHFGSEKTVNYTSETKDKFIPQESKSNNNQDISKNLKGHHFTLAETTKQGEQSKNYFATVHKQEYNYKGDPSQIRGKMADEVKADLRASHFKVGFEQISPFGQFQSRPISASVSRPGGQFQQANGQNQGNLSMNSSQQILRPYTSIPGSNQQSQQKKIMTAAEMNASSHVFSQSKDKIGSDYKTSNQQFFKWIQPSIY